MMHPWEEYERYIKRKLARAHAKRRLTAEQSAAFKHITEGGYYEQSTSHIRDHLKELPINPSSKRGDDKCKN